VLPLPAQALRKPSSADRAAMAEPSACRDPRVPRARGGCRHSSPTRFRRAFGAGAPHCSTSGRRVPTTLAAEQAGARAVDRAAMAEPSVVEIPAAHVPVAATDILCPPGFDGRSALGRLAAQPAGGGSRRRSLAARPAGGRSRRDSLAAEPAGGGAVVDRAAMAEPSVVEISADRETVVAADILCPRGFDGRSALGRLTAQPAGGGSRRRSLAAQPAGGGSR
jgi:hypothetical protein